MDEEGVAVGGKVPAGQYANYFEIGHNAFEFVIDFGECYSQAEAPRMHTRIITGPGYARALLALLKESIARYEDLHGPIENA